MIRKVKGKNTKQQQRRRLWSYTKKKKREITMPLCKRVFYMCLIDHSDQAKEVSGFTVFSFFLALLEEYLYSLYCDSLQIFLQVQIYVQNEREREEGQQKLFSAIKIGRPSFPIVNGVQYFSSYVFFFGSHYVQNINTFSCANCTSHGKNFTALDAYALCSMLWGQFWYKIR